MGFFLDLSPAIFLLDSLISSQLINVIVVALLFLEIRTGPPCGDTKALMYFVSLK